LTDLEDLTFQFWNAAKFHRRAPDRDQENARKALGNVAIKSHSRRHHRAVAILKEIYHDHDDSGPGREPTDGGRRA